MAKRYSILAKILSLFLFVLLPNPYAYSESCEDNFVNPEALGLPDKIDHAYRIEKDPALAWQLLEELRAFNLSCEQLGQSYLIEGNLNEKEGNDLKAAESFAKFLQYSSLEPEIRQSYLYATGILYYLGKTHKGVDYLDEWLSANPEIDERRWQLIVDVFAFSERGLELLPILKGYLDRSPPERKLIYFRQAARLAGTYLDAAQRDTVIDWIETERGIQDLSVEDQAYILRALRQQYPYKVDPASVISLTDQIFDLGVRTESEDFVLLMRSYYHLGSYSEAYQWAEKIVTHDEKYLDDLDRFYIAKINEALGNKRAARRNFSKIDDLEQVIEMVENGTRIDPSATEDAYPISAPRPRYPGKAATQKIEGECMVFFDVSSSGVPFGITADCTDDIFHDASIKAVKKVRFEPKKINGLALTRRNVVYPLVYHLD